MTFSGRVGIAYHETIQQMIEEPVPQGSAAAEHARSLFSNNLVRQYGVKSARPRETRLGKDPTRVTIATQAVMAEGIRISNLKHDGILPERIAVQRAATAAGLPKLSSAPVHVEVPVRTEDGLFYGRIDRMERTDGGWHLTDFKLALRDDLPDRYVRQVQMYASMWYDSYGEWPAAATVAYPLLGKSYAVDVSPEASRLAVDDARRIVAQLLPPSPPPAGTPGDVCAACEFRPWCSAFWRWQAGKSDAQALSESSLGVEGVVSKYEMRNMHIHLQIRWRAAMVTLIAPQERFPHLLAVREGQAIRLTDARLHGLRHQPRATVGETTEIFIMAS